MYSLFYLATEKRQVFIFTFSEDTISEEDTEIGDDKEENKRKKNKKEQTFKKCSNQIFHLRTN